MYISFISKTKSTEIKQNTFPSYGHKKIYVTPSPEIREEN